MTLLCFPSVLVWTSHQHKHNVKQTSTVRARAHTNSFLKKRERHVQTLPNVRSVSLNFSETLSDVSCFPTSLPFSPQSSVRFVPCGNVRWTTSRLSTVRSLSASWMRCVRVCVCACEPRREGWWCRALGYCLITPVLICVTPGGDVSAENSAVASEKN